MTARPNGYANTHTGLPSHNGALTPTHAAIAAYRAWSHDSMFVPPPTVAQVRLIAEYCQEYINEFTYPVENGFWPPLKSVDEDDSAAKTVFEAITYLRRRVAYIRTLDDLADWLWDCRQFARLEPL